MEISYANKKNKNIKNIFLLLICNLNEAELKEKTFPKNNLGRMEKKKVNYETKITS